MTALEASGLWVGLHMIFLTYISYRVGQARIKHKVNLGDGGIDDVQKAIRAQGNYTEYAPAALLGLVLLAVLGAPVLLVNLLGSFFLFARVAHFLGLGAGLWPKGRFIGTVATVITLLITGVALVWFALT